jgi:hypothetical protein
MDEAVDGGQSHGLVWKTLAPIAEWLIGRDQHGAPLVAASDQLEQHAGFGLILADVDDVIEDPAQPAAAHQGAEYEQQFGGKRPIEATLFYDADGKLLPPLPEIVIVEGSSIDKAYSDAGIEHRVTSPQSLIAKGYCNPFLLKLATPAESDLVPGIIDARNVI